MTWWPARQPTACFGWWSGMYARLGCPIQILACPQCAWTLKLWEIARVESYPLLSWPCNKIIQDSFFWVHLPVVVCCVCDFSCWDFQTLASNTLMITTSPLPQLRCLSINSVFGTFSGHAVGAWLWGLARGYLHTAPENNNGCCWKAAKGRNEYIFVHQREPLYKQTSSNTTTTSDNSILLMWYECFRRPDMKSVYWPRGTSSWVVEPRLCNFRNEFY